MSKLKVIGLVMMAAAVAAGAAVAWGAVADSGHRSRRGRAFG